VISIEGLAVTRGHRVVAAVDRLTVEPGEAVALVGESGAGRTTVASCVLGFAPDSVSASVVGRVLVDGVDMVAAPDRQRLAVRGATVALVAQNPRASLPPATRLGRVMTSALRRHGVAKADVPARIDSAVRALVLDRQLLDRYPHQVSDGQAQRFALALAVALGARYLVADEPTGALDVTVAGQVVASLRALRDDGLGILLATHDLDVVTALADRVAVMHDGRVVEHGRVDEVLDGPAHPATRALVDAWRGAA
jgi:peptide/nickel transport system ATP-binding protein